MQLVVEEVDRVVVVVAATAFALLVGLVVVCRPRRQPVTLPAEKREGADRPRERQRMPRRATQRHTDDDHTTTPSNARAPQTEEQQQRRANSSSSVLVKPGVETDRPPAPPLEVKPLRTLAEVLAWTSFNDPCTAYTTLPCAPRHSRQGPQLLVCHDMRGGYTDGDQFVHGSDQGQAFHLYHWHLVDTFCYFSHNLCTLPPLGWINVAHTHGVKVLGTWITEWEAGAALCQEMLSSPALWRQVADQLACIAQAYGFDGWLVNIENRIVLEHVPFLTQFVEHLRRACHERLGPAATVLWYDSVTAQGLLDWQNELNAKNSHFFQASDGIFLNYTWTPAHLVRTAIAAKNKKEQVFGGVDVFGRGTFAGGQLQSYKAVKALHEHGLSVALFAPGWIYEEEKFRGGNLLANQYMFWQQFEPYVVGHPIAALPLTTSFSVGQGSRWCVEGDQVNLHATVNLSLQDPLPNIAHGKDNPYFPSSGSLALKEATILIDQENAWDGPSSLRLSLPAAASPITGDDPRAVFRLIALDVSHPGPLVIDMTAREDGARLALMLVLRPNSSGVRYLELPFPHEPIRNTTPLAALSENIHAKFRAKYAHEPSLVLAREAERRVLQAAAVEPTSGGAGGGWISARFVIVEPELPSLPIQEIRLVARRADSDLEPGLGLTAWLGHLALYHPRDLSVPSVTHLRASNLFLSAVEGGGRCMNLELQWKRAQTHVRFLVYVDARVVACTSFDRLTLRHELAPERESKDLTVGIRAISHAGVKEPLLGMARLSVTWT